MWRASRGRESHVPQDQPSLNLATSRQVAEDLDHHSPCLFTFGAAESQKATMKSSVCQVISTPCHPLGEDLQFTLTLPLAVSIKHALKETQAGES